MAVVTALWILVAGAPATAAADEPDLAPGAAIVVPRHGLQLPVDIAHAALRRSDGTARALRGCRSPCILADGALQAPGRYELTLVVAGHGAWQSAGASFEIAGDELEVSVAFRSYAPIGLRVVVLRPAEDAVVRWLRPGRGIDIATTGERTYLLDVQDGQPLGFVLRGESGWTVARRLEGGNCASGRAEVLVSRRSGARFALLRVRGTLAAGTHRRVFVLWEREGEADPAGVLHGRAVVLPFRVR